MSFLFIEHKNHAVLPLPGVEPWSSRAGRRTVRIKIIQIMELFIKDSVSNSSLQ